MGTFHTQWVDATTNLQLNNLVMDQLFNGLRKHCLKHIVQWCLCQPTCRLHKPIHSNAKTPNASSFHKEDETRVWFWVIETVSATSSEVVQTIRAQLGFLLRLAHVSRQIVHRWMPHLLQMTSLQFQLWIPSGPPATQPLLSGLALYPKYCYQLSQFQSPLEFHSVLKVEFGHWHKRDHGG